MPEKFEYLTKEIAYPVIARYLNSGGLASSFYKAEGWSEGQFYSWRKRYMKDHNLPVTTGSRKVAGKDASPVFHPIEVSAPTEKQPATSDRIELEYPNGVILRIDAATESRIASLVKLY